jgi:hypothetical protein
LPAKSNKAASGEKTGPKLNTVAVSRKKILVKPKRQQKIARQPSVDDKYQAAIVKKKSAVGKSVASTADKTAKRKPVKGFLSAEGSLVGPKYFFSTDIPDTYNDTYMRAIPRDPLWIYTYWELTDKTFELMKRHVGADVYNKARWVLRVLDVTDVIYDGFNAWRQMDIDLTPYAVNWYIKVWEPARTYLIQYGIVTPDSRFFSAVNSNSVQMPRLGMSAVTDQEWTTASTDELIRLSGFGLKRDLGASENSAEFSLANLTSGAGLGSGSFV